MSIEPLTVTFSFEAATDKIGLQLVTVDNA
jgi:hypothetical protein